MAPHPEQTLTLHYHPWEPAAQALRLALGLKGVGRTDHRLPYNELATFYRLGQPCRTPLLEGPDGHAEHLGWDDFPSLDIRFGAQRAPAPDADAWAALRRWLDQALPLLARLAAPVGYAWRGLGDDADARAAHAREARRRFGLTLEALANDRYAAFGQLSALSRLPELGRHLARQGWYLGRPSLADAVLAGALFPLQLLDGIALPIHLLYYLRRVQDEAGVDLEADLLISL